MISTAMSMQMDLQHVSVWLQQVKTITQLMQVISVHSSIGDFVWNDLNGNNLQDGNEPGDGRQCHAVISFRIYGSQHIYQCQWLVFVQ